MARPLRIEYEGAFYHVIQRGIERKNIFISDQDKEKLLSYFNLSHTAYNAVFHSYILMNNHYHIILETPHGNLSKIMHYINTSYAAYFNTKHKRVGPLYQGRFKAILVQQDEYLHYLSRYIHLNPVRARIAKSPEEYRWSSYGCFTQAQTPPAWLNISFILSMFVDNIQKAKRLYKQFVSDSIDKEKEIIANNTKLGLILGDEGFFESIRAKFINKNDKEIPLLKELKQKKEPALEQIQEVVIKNVDNDKRLQRSVGIYLSRKYTQRTLNDIAGFYGKITDAGISQTARRLQKKREEDDKLNKRLLELERRVDLLNVET
jgi:putative transposase